MPYFLVKLVVLLMLCPGLSHGATRRDSATVQKSAVGRVDTASGNRASLVMRNNTQGTPPSTSSTQKQRTTRESRVVASRGSRADETTKNTASVTAGRASGNVISRAASTDAVRARVAVSSNQVATRTAMGAKNATAKNDTTRASRTRAVTIGNTKDATSLAASMTALAELTTVCKTRYTECMDNFCNVLDETLGRCSCSKNIKNYEKTENALKSANEALQDVAQQIQYIGLSKSEIETLFTQTEAEAVMSGANDNSQIKNDLDKIKGLIVQVKPGTATSSDLSNGLSLDLSGLLNINIGTTGFDLSSLFGTKSADTNSIANQRGEQLYKTAAARCKTAVLNECKEHGVDISVVSNAYDMEIDKQCIAYERSLTQQNQEIVQTVRNAQNILQRARLMVAQQKNSYDLRGCINALDSCMQDDTICGSDYENCLDPSGKYIVDGAIIIGSLPGQSIDNYNTMGAAQYSADGLYSTWNYNVNANVTRNAWGASGDEVESGSLSEYISYTLTGLPTKTSESISEYLQYKIGYIKNNKSYGMCAAALKQCQDYTFTDKEYNPKNRVVEEFLTRTLIKIKTAQDRIMSDYAMTCVADVKTCLDDNDFEESNTDGSKSKIAINACRSQIVTCMSVSGRTDLEPTPGAIKEWIDSVVGNETASSNGSDGGPSNSQDGSDKQPPIGFECTYIDIAYHTNGGSNVESQTCQKDASITLPGAPMRDGYTFSKWQIGSSKYDASASVGYDTLKVAAADCKITISAEWTPNTLILDFNVCDDCEDITSIQCTFGTKFKLPANTPTRKGYTFGTWQINGADYAAGAEISCNYSTLGAYQDTVIASATWTENDPEKITLTFNVDGGDAVRSMKCTFGQKFNLPAGTWRDGYTFNKWLLNGTEYDAKASCDCSKDVLGVESGSVAIQALWTPRVIGLHYYNTTNDAHWTEECTYDQPFTLPDAPTYQNYTFNGWVVGDQETMRQSGETLQCNSTDLGQDVLKAWNVDIDAQMKGVPKSITYDLGGGELTGTAAPSKCTYGSNFTLPDAPTRNGYAFRGWTIGDKTYGANANNAYCSGNVTVTANWVRDSETYELVLMHLTGTNGSNSTTYYVDANGNVFSDAELKTRITQIDVPTKTGYVFKGYSDMQYSIYYGDPWIDANGNVTSRVKPQNVTLYAEWEVPTYDGNITLNINYNKDIVGTGGYDYTTGQAWWKETETGTKTFTCSSGGSADVAALCNVSPSKSHTEYSYSAWYTHGGKSCPVTSHAAVKALKQVNSTILWVNNDNDISYSYSEYDSGSYNVYFDGWGGKFNTGKGYYKETCGKDGSITVPDAPSIPGYKFNGWELSNGGISDMEFFYRVYPGQKLICNQGTFLAPSGDVYFDARYVPNHGGAQFMVASWEVLDCVNGDGKTATKLSWFAMNDLVGWYSTQARKTYNRDNPMKCDDDTVGKIRLWPLVWHADASENNLMLNFGGQWVSCPVGSTIDLTEISIPVGRKVTFGSKTYPFTGWHAGNGRVFPSNAKIVCNKENFIFGNMNTNAAYLEPGYVYPRTMSNQRIEFIDWFDEDNEEFVNYRSITCSNGRVTAPAAPIRPGYEFVAWRKYSYRNERFDGETSFQPKEYISCEEDLWGCITGEADTIIAEWKKL